MSKLFSDAINKMPYKRRYAKKRPAYRKKRYVRRGRWVSSKVPKVHRVKEMYNYAKNPYLGQSVAAPALSMSKGIITGRLADLSNFASFQGIFDLYKITGMKVKMIPRWNSAEAGAIGSRLPTLYIAPNRDPYVTAPLSIDDILNDDMVKVIPLRGPLNFYLRSPKAALLTQPAEEGDPVQLMPLQFNVGNKYQPWLTTGGVGHQIADQSVFDHFGYRWLLDNTQNSVDITVDTYITLYISFKEQD